MNKLTRSFGFQILDFSDNKLQELHADTLSSYTSIKYLYLAENQIYSIDKDAFTYLTYLQTLDLSKNVILELSDSIFQLPSLRKLYLNGNPLLHLSLNGMEITKPIKAPLELLDLSDCKIKTLPDFGVLPQLLLYNISHNPLISFDPSPFSSMCKLAKVDVTESLDKIKVCDMKLTIMWFQEKRVYFQLGDYTRLNSRGKILHFFSYTKLHKNFFEIYIHFFLEYENCRKMELPESLNISYHNCRMAYTEVSLKIIKILRYTHTGLFYNEVSG